MTAPSMNAINVSLKRREFIFLLASQHIKALASPQKR